KCGSGFYPARRAQCKLSAWQIFFINGGYNFLIAKDKQVMKDIEDGKIYRREPNTGKSTLVQKGDYFGLYNSSKHTANFGLRYKNIKYKSGATLSVKYRGKYGFQGDE